VLRDEKDIICVLCRGADEKTKVRDGTRNVLFYSYAVPGIDRSYLKEGLTVCRANHGPVWRGKHQGLRDIRQREAYERPSTAWPSYFPQSEPLSFYD